MINITWDIVDVMRTNDDNKSVTAVRWTVTAVDSDSGEQASIGKMESFLANPSSTDFIPFADLTKETVIGWVQDKVGKDKMETMVTNSLNNKLNPTIVQDNPWA